MTLLCVPIFVTDVAQAKRDIASAVEAGAQIVELRLDSGSDATIARTLIADFDIPFIFTCRPTWEGGHSVLSDEGRLGLLAEIAPFDARSLLDIELATLGRTGSDAIENRIIASSHDFKGRPNRLYNLVSELNQSKADVAKIVWMARTVRDNIEAFEILKNRVKPTIAICMGEAGLISRVLAKKFGAFLTFAELSKGVGTAPGQVPIADMKNLYRWDAIGPKTQVFGVVGSPIAHSMSPAIHNAAFSKIGYDGVYVPLLVNEGYESFKAFMESFLAFEPLDLRGLSITIPHKENALRYLQERGDAEIDPLTESIGALNTISIDRASGRLRFRSTSTDYGAILDSITSKMNITREDLADYRVAVIGAGGTGRTAVAALAHYGATVVIYNRTKERADALAKEFDGRTGKVVTARMEKLCDSCCHIFINTTSIGMHPNIDASPLGDRIPEFTDETVVFDAVYNPIKTKFLQQAEQAGARTINGVEMFVRQAAGQFELWTNQNAPIDVMRSVIENRLRG